jgi:hypothetical protein
VSNDLTAGESEEVKPESVFVHTWNVRVIVSGEIKQTVPYDDDGGLPPRVGDILSTTHGGTAKPR